MAVRSPRGGNLKVGRERNEINRNTNPAPLPDLDCVCLHHKSDMEQQDKRRKREALTYAGCFPLSRGGASGEVRLMIAGVASEGACEGASCLHQSLRLKCLSTGNQGKHSIACECGQHMHSATSEHIVRARRVMACVLCMLAYSGLFGQVWPLWPFFGPLGPSDSIWTHRGRFFVTGKSDSWHFAGMRATKCNFHRRQTETFRLRSISGCSSDVVISLRMFRSQRERKKERERESAGRRKRLGPQRY